MTHEAALLKAIVAAPDEDTPRLAYADWLDENRPDPRPSPSCGPSARAEYIRVQCRLAAGAFDDADGFAYPDLLEREKDLADWLGAHSPDELPELDGLYSPRSFDTGEWGDYRRGFLEVVTFDGYEEEPAATVAQMAATLRRAFRQTPGRTLIVEDATAGEIALFARHPVFARLRGLVIDYLDRGDEDEAVVAVAGSPRAAGLRRLYFDFPLGVAGCRSLAASPHLRNLESLVIDYPIPAASLKELVRGKWFRNLRRLGLSSGGGDAFRVLAALPPMPRLVSLTLHGSVVTTPAGVRRFAASESFPRLAHLDLAGARLPAESVAALARGDWPLRHLALTQNDVRRAGAEAIAAAPFAGSLRVLDLRECEVTAGGVQALADSESLAGLRHLDLAGNPVGPGGLAALAAGPHLRGLRALDLGHTNTARGPVSARAVCDFLAALDTPELRHLTLDGLPVAVRGARALATSPAFRNLTRLRLENCGLGERGTREIVAPRTLRGLVALALAGNNLGAAAGRLANPKVFPRLARCRLGHSIPRATATRVRRRPGIEG